MCNIRIYRLTLISLIFNKVNEEIYIYIYISEVMRSNSSKAGAYTVYCKNELIFLAECSIKRLKQFNAKFIQPLFKNRNGLFHLIELSGG